MMMGGITKMMGTLVVGGMHADENNTATGLGATNRLASGLRIAGAPVGEQPMQEATSATANATNEKYSNAAKNFSTELFSRLKQAQNNNPNSLKNAKDAQDLVDSITTSIDEIKTQFGQEAANQAMAEILTSTESGVSSSRIAGAISEVLRGISAANQAVLNSDHLTGERYEEAKKIDQQLTDFVEYLNSKENYDQVDERPLGLSLALNDYFGDANLQEKDQKIFDANFEWLTVKEIEAKKAEDDDKDCLKLSVKELGQDAVNKIATFLRDELGNKEAASYIANLSEDDDIFKAVDHVRTMMFEDTHLVSGGLDEKTGLPSLVHREGTGVTQSFELNQFLSSEILDAVNSALRDDPELKERFTTYVADKQYGGDTTKVPDGLGLATWPGGMLGSIYGPAHRSTVYLANIGNSTAEERKTDFLAQSGDFWKEAAKNSSNQNAAEYETIAKNCGQTYQDYISGRQATKPGTMVNKDA